MFALLIAFLGNLFVTSVSAKSVYGTSLAENVTLFNVVSIQICILRSKINEIFSMFIQGTFINNEYGYALKVIWAIGLLAAGQCSTITGTYAGQFIMEVNIF